MSEQLQKRFKRMQRLYRISDALAKAAEGEMRDRQMALETERERLSSVQNYRQEYSQLATSREQTAITVSDMSKTREFALWLTSVESQQVKTVDRCEFVAESAREGAAQARRFARGLELIAEKRQVALQKYQDKQEQAMIDALRPSPESQQLAL